MGCYTIGLLPLGSCVRAELAVMLLQVPYVETHENAPRTAWLSTEGRCAGVRVSSMCAGVVSAHALAAPEHEGLARRTEQVHACGCDNQRLCMVLACAWEAGSPASCLELHGSNV